MLKFECKELGTNCDYMAQGNILVEVKNDAMQHAQYVHKGLLSNMSHQQLTDLERTLQRKTYQP
jgi:predicted small metal-binding protein